MPITVRRWLLSVTESAACSRLIKERWLCQIIKPTSFLETETTLELSTLSASTMTLQRDLLSSSRTSVMSSYGSTPAKLRSLAENLTEGRSPRASLLLIPCRRPRPTARVANRNLVDLYADAGVEPRQADGDAGMSDFGDMPHRLLPGGGASGCLRLNSGL